MPRKKRHVSFTTLLIVGEGSDDKAFIDHMKRLFHERHSGQTFAVKAGDGGSPKSIITHAIRAYKATDFNQRYLVLDADIPPTSAERKKAGSAGYQIILWQPQCLEGALLEVLGEAVRAHESSQALKSRLHPRLAAHHTQPEAYERLFTKSVLQSTGNTSVAAVRNLFS